MNLARIIHLTLSLCLGYEVYAIVVLDNLALSPFNIVAILFWLTLLWAQLFRPARWSGGIGIFLLAIVTIQFALWRIAVANADRIDVPVNTSLLTFWISELPLLVGGGCGIGAWCLRRRSRKATRPNTTN